MSDAPPIRRGTVVCLGVSQLVCWGVTYYLIGGFGDAMVADLGWSPSIVYGGFSAALLVMGLSSAWAGRLIDRLGGRTAMSAGSIASALGCAALAASWNVASYYAAWIVLGVAMRLTLYDAAFASLARIGGPLARRPISQVTLLGGLASTVFWPIGHALADAFGWRGAVVTFGGFALATLPLHRAIPDARWGGGVAGSAAARTSLARSPRDRTIAALLYAAICTLANFLNAGMSAHMISLLASLGLALSTAVWIASLRGIGQSAARVCEVAFGGRVHPLDLNLLASVVLAVAFAAALLGGHLALAAVAFAAFYGAGNGIVTITRGTLPLVLFDPRTYGAFVGRLLVPSFLFSAIAPLAYALVIERFGDVAALWLSLAAATAILAAALALRLRFGGRQTGPEPAGRRP